MTTAFHNLNKFNLTALQQAGLNRLLPLFSKVADLIGGQVILGVTNADNKLYAINGFEPHTNFNPLTKINYPYEISLDRNTMQALYELKQKVNLGLSSILGTPMFIYIYPITMEEEVIALAICGVDQEQHNSYGLQRLLTAGEKIIQQGERSLIACPSVPIDHHMGLIITDKFSRVSYSNKIAQQIYYQLGINNLQGKYMEDSAIYSPGQKETYASHDPYTKEIATDNLVLIIRTWPIYEAGNLIMKIIILENVTKLRQKDEEIKIKSAVIQEIHHRMKNSLQMVASLLRMQSRRTNETEVKKALTVAENRILSIGLVHDMLSTAATDSADVAQVLSKIAKEINLTVSYEDFNLQGDFNFQSLNLPSQMIVNLAMVFNELLLNSVEHGFPGEKLGRVKSSFSVIDDEFIFDYEDQGVGYPPEILAGKFKSLGLRIIHSLVTEQLKGSYELYNSPGAGIKIKCKYR